MRPVATTADNAETIDPGMSPTPPAAGRPAVSAAQFGGGVPTLERDTDPAFLPAVPYPMGRSSTRSLAALVVLICPTTLMNADIQARVVAQIRSGMSYMPWIAAWGLRLCFELLDWAPRFLFKGIRRLRGIEPEKARAILHQLSESSLTPIRTLMYAVKGLILNAYFDQQEVHQALNYAPAPFMRDRIALRQRMLAGEAPEAADYIPTYPGVNA